MQALSLDLSSKAFLTKTVITKDPSSQTETSTSFPVDFKGTPIVAPGSPLPIYRDTFTGKTFVRIAEQLPSGTDSASVAARAAILSQSPTHFCSEDSTAHGWYIEAPDFNGREGK